MRFEVARPPWYALLKSRGRGVGGVRVVPDDWLMRQSGFKRTRRFRR